MIYLDHNATTPLEPAAAEVWLRIARECFGNPGSRHAVGRQARISLEDARESIAHCLGAEPDEVYFTSGGTESNNLALHLLTSGPPGVLAISRGDHPSVVETCLALIARGQRLSWLPFTDRGLLVPPEQARLPVNDVRVVSVLMAHNETGVIQSLEEWSDWAVEHRIPLHVDAVQAAGKLAINFRDMGATTLSLAAHKFGGPRGVGGLLIRRGVRKHPLLLGGHQESGQRAGTESVALIAAMAQALRGWTDQREQRTALLAQLRDRLQQGLCQSAEPVVVHGHRAPRLPNTLNIAFPGLDGEALLVALDLAGVCCSMGSACASGSSEPSPVLLDMGCAREIARSSLRFSVGLSNTLEEIDAAVRIIVDLVRQWRSGK